MSACADLPGAEQEIELQWLLVLICMQVPSSKVPTWCNQATVHDASKPDGDTPHCAASERSNFLDLTGHASSG